MKVAFESQEMAWERDLEKCGMCISCELRKAERQMGVVGKYLIGTRIYQI